jgi:UDP-glucose 4-epimerase
LENKRILITGGTRSLGQILVRRLLARELGMPRKIIVFSRDEAKQHFMRPVVRMHREKIYERQKYISYIPSCIRL